MKAGTDALEQEGKGSYCMSMSFGKSSYFYIHKAIA